MSELAQEMNGLEQEIGGGQQQPQEHQESGSRGFNPEEHKATVKEALMELEEDHKLKQQQLRNQEERQHLAKRQQMERQDYTERAEEALNYLEQFYEESPEFKQVMDDVDVSPQLVAQVADLCNDDEIPSVIAELATNEEMQEKLGKATTEAGVKRVIRSTRKQVLSGNTPQQVHPMYNSSQVNSDVNIGDESEDAYYRNMSAGFNSYR